MNPWNLDQLQEIERETGKRVYTILQLRTHPALIEIKEKISKDAVGKTKHNVVLTYITSRGPWYNYSWKGREDISGGVATNIGIHFFDMLIWMFGSLQKNHLFLRESNKAAGFIELQECKCTVVSVHRRQRSAKRSC